MLRNILGSTGNVRTHALSTKPNLRGSGQLARLDRWHACPRLLTLSSARKLSFLQGRHKNVRRSRTSLLHTRSLSSFMKDQTQPTPNANIILMGSPGSGKTTIGHLLAEKLQKPSIDIDNDVLEKLWGMSVDEKLASVGDEEFVRAEGEAALQFTGASDSIISLTGSNPLHAEAMEHLSGMGLVVYLDVQSSDILTRLEKMKVNRIVGQGGSPMSDVLDYHQQFYEGSYDIRVICQPNESVESVVDKIARKVSAYKDHHGYSSTREDITNAAPKSFNDAVLEGLAWDGGLYVPADYLPFVSLKEWYRLVPLSYQERSLRILEMLIHPSHVHPSVLRDMIGSAYNPQTFAHEEIFPITQTQTDKIMKSDYLLELFHGPTGSFKDAALQLMPGFFQHAVQQSRSANDRRHLVLVATSGDTGGAVLDGFGALQSSEVSVMVLYPESGISDIQKAQMTSATGDNVHVVGVKSDFDFCQTSLKQIFRDRQLAKQLEKDFSCRLSSGNSLNWGRLVPQIVHHASGYLDMVQRKIIPLGQPVDLCVPTGNFGNILAAYYAKKMGLPLRRLISASNENNVLTEFINTGYYTLLGRTLFPSVSPAIDILKSSNLERLIHDIVGGDHHRVRTLYELLDTDGRFGLNSRENRRVQETFAADWCSSAAALRYIKTTFDKTGYLLDPHSAVASVVGRKFHTDDTPMLIASTAHYAKFAPDVLMALGCKVSHDPLEQLAELENMGARPSMHQGIKECLSRPKRHHKVLDASVDQIVNEIKHFLSQ